MLNANSIATVSGTLQHNILFAQDNKNITILERNVLINDIQLDVNIIKKANYLYVDAHHTVYNVSEGYGPFMMYFTDELQRYAEDNNYLAPGKEFLSNKYKKGILKKYLRAYTKAYGYSHYLDKWHYNQIIYISEAEKKADDNFFEYLHRIKPLFWFDYLSLHFIKQIIKKL